ncbi:MAG: N-formylglutamate amidohydrolase [Gammaproteobacteria bacterium]
MNPPPFVHLAPRAEERPVLVSIPHAGTAVPPRIFATFASDAMRGLPMTDWHVHCLYDFLPQLGIDVLQATYSRFVIDLNRPPDPRPLYPGRFETGLVAGQTFQGEPIYSTPPDAAEIEERKRRFYEPYHARLDDLLEAKRRRFGRAVLIDAHSVASSPSLLHGALDRDIYLGDRDGATCGSWLREFFEHAFTRAGLKVSLNEPYKGGYTTDHYGRLPGIEALQIEMCQRVYMDEKGPDAALGHPRFAATREMLRDIFQRFVTTIARGNPPS